jgi:hypothetical protein
VALSAEALAKEVAADKAAAIAKYKEKGLVVTGEISKKEKTKAGGTEVSLNGSGTIEVRCELIYNAEWMTDPLKVGQKVKLYGTLGSSQFDEKMIKMTYCFVISQP